MALRLLKKLQSLEKDGSFVHIIEDDVIYG